MQLELGEARGAVVIAVVRVRGADLSELVDHELAADHEGVRGAVALDEVRGAAAGHDVVWGPACSWAR